MILQCVCDIWIEYTIQKVHEDAKSEPPLFAFNLNVYVLIR